MKELILSRDKLCEVCRLIPKEGVVFLKGDLASGKTSLVKAMARFLGIEDEVNSPTFSIMQYYKSRDTTLFHYDIYQEGSAKIFENGLFENFFEKGIHFVEWGDENLADYLNRYGISILNIEISVLNGRDNERKYRIYE